MTEDDWPECDDPEPMAGYLRDKWEPGERKLRLFAVACCRRIWHLIPDERSRSAVEVAERFADGLAKTKELTNAHEEARRAAAEALDDALAALRAAIRDPNFWWDNREGLPYSAQATAAAVAPLWASEVVEFEWYGPVEGLDLDQRLTIEALAHAAVPLSPSNDTPANRERRHAVAQAERAIQVQLLRDLFGNPFRPATIGPDWRTPRILRLAEEVYHGRAFELVPILGDALEESGCQDRAVLDHCREREVHARGCWVIDGLLGNS
jgi:hypothetical protein